MEDIVSDWIKHSETSIIMNVFIAAILTMVVGLERERASKAAGMRTNMIVGSFTCLVVSLIDPLIDYVNQQNTEQLVETDPIRVLQAIVIGVSFIGAGTIIKRQRRESVIGLTTAATLLYTVGIGMSVAIGYYLLAVFLTAFILLINRVVNYIENHFVSDDDKG